MIAFEIHFDPPLAPGPRVVLPLDLNQFSPKMKDYYPDNFIDMFFCMGDQKRRYYPSSPWTILDDLYRELSLSSEKVSHDVLLSGYPIFHIMFKNDKAIFYDLASGQEGLKPNPIAPSVSSSHVVDELERALGSIVQFVQATDRPPQ